MIADNIENWRLINDYNNYEISSHGRVRNNQTNRILKQSLRSGYFSVGLIKEGEIKRHDIHRMVSQAFIPNPNNLRCVDHKDNNKFNNHVNNLRWCSSQENNMNRSKQQNTTSIYKGVYLNKNNKKWYAKIVYNNRQIHLGMFDDEIDAARKYNEKALELFGEFSKLNIFT